MRIKIKPRPGAAVPLRAEPALSRRPYPTEDTLVERYQPGCLDLPGVLQRITQADPRFACLPLRRADREADPAVSPRPPKGLVDDLVAINPRNNEVLSLTLPGGRRRIYQQTFGHVGRTPAGALQSHGGTTLSSKAIKRDHRRQNAYMRDYNANLGSIGVDQGPQLMVRSGRSDTPTRLEELLAFGAAGAGKKQKLPPDEEGRLIYRPVLMSAMDMSFTKAVWMQLRRLFGKPPDIERAFLRRQQRAIDRLFGKASFIERRIDGKVFRLERPTVFNLPFSSRANSARTIRRARRRNRPAYQALLSQLVTVWNDSKNRTTPAMRRLVDLLQNSDDLASQRAWLRLPELDPNCLHGLSDAERMALQALKLGLTGRSLDGKKQEDPLSPGHELLQLQQAWRQAGMMPHLQCKSGLDRTRTGVAILMMGDMFRVRHGERLFDPLDPANLAANAAEAQRLFTQAAQTFGTASIKMVRGMASRGTGEWRLGRRGAHPFPQAYYRP